MNKTEKLEESIATNNENCCYVEVTCKEPSINNGKLLVEMVYHGDPVLVAFVLERAKSFLEHNEDCG